jgi:hypothetical protein
VHVLILPFGGTAEGRVWSRVRDAQRSVPEVEAAGEMKNCEHENMSEIDENDERQLLESRYPGLPDASRRASSEMPSECVPRSVEELERLHDRGSQLDHLIEVCRVEGIDGDRDRPANGDVEHVETDLLVRADRPHPLPVGLTR